MGEISGRRRYLGYLSLANLTFEFERKWLSPVVGVAVPVMILVEKYPLITGILLAGEAEYGE